jgi:ABC-type branched-subunit amino acid transport system ATPase component
MDLTSFGSFVVVPVPFPIRLTYHIPELYGGRPQTLMLHDGLTTLIGPNGSGKTQVLRHLISQLESHAAGRIVRYLSAGRLASFERQRSLANGHLVPVLPAENDEPTTLRHANGGSSVLLRLSVSPELRIKVTERLRSLFSRQIVLEWDHAGLWIRFSRGVGAGDSYSSAREARGLLQLVVVLAALYDDAIGVLLLDEPELSLHPQLQAFLLREIRHVAGDPVERGKKLIVMSTHATDMIAVRHARDIAKVVFFRDPDQDPLQVPKESEGLASRKIQGLIPHFGETYKHAFFTSRPLLVEGPSDSVICNALDELADLSLAAAGSQVVPVAGKGTMLNVVSFMRLIGKQPVILADLDGFADAPDLAMSFAAHPHAQRIAEAKGHPSLFGAVRSAYDRFANAVAAYWDELEPLAQSHPYWVRRRTEDQARRRAALAVLLTFARSDLLALPHGELWERLQRRLTALFDLLEAVGCFIIRKGTIESYYLTLTPESQYPDKITAALFEADSWSGHDRSEVLAAYGDVLRALRHAAATQEALPSQTLADLVVAFAGPVLHRLSDETTDDDVAVLVRRILGDHADRFSVSVNRPADGLPGLRIALADGSEVPGFPMRLTGQGDLAGDVRLRLRLPPDRRSDPAG